MDFVKERFDKPIHKTPLHYCATEDGIDVEIILQWTGNRDERFYLFSNGGENENGGTPITGIKTSLTNYFKKRLKGEAAPDILRKGLETLDEVGQKTIKIKLRMDEYSNLEKNNFQFMSQDLEVPIPIARKIYNESFEKLSKYCQEAIN